MVILKEMKMGDLCEEVLEEILSYVPFKPLTRMKCVSKDWYRLITNIRRSRPRVSVLGFMLFEFFADVVDEDELVPNYLFKTLVYLFDVKDQGGELEYFEHNTLHLTLEGFIKCWCSSNGFFLCTHEDFMDSPFIYKPFLKQREDLPRFDEFRYSSRNEIGVGLVYDGLPNSYFKVVCFSFPSTSLETVDCQEVMDCVIFSSETREWRKHRAPLLNSSIMDDMEFSRFGNKPYALFYEGLMYWTFYEYLLVYNLQEDFFEIHHRPKIDEYICTYSRIHHLPKIKKKCTEHSDICLWLSEGCLHFCSSNKDGIYVWARQKGEEVDYDDERFQDLFNVQLHYYLEHDRDWWLLKRTVDLETLKAQHPDIFSTINWERCDHLCFLNPCAFNEALQVLYLRLPGSVPVSYSFETGRLSKVKTLSLQHG